MDTMCSKLKDKSALVSLLKDNSLLYDFSNTELALEREALRVNKNSGLIAETLHPEFYEPKNKNRYFTTDFAEAQVEFITQKFNTAEELYDNLNLLHDIFMLDMEEDEILFPYSMPPKLPSTDSIKRAIFDDSESGKSSMVYRDYLIEKYGKKVQLISGIHFNFSFNEDFITKLYKLSECKQSYNKFKSEIYFKTMRNYLKYKYMIVLFQGASPICDETFAETNRRLSIRNSELGYNNKEELGLDYSNLDSYLDSVEKAKNKGLIYDEREIYSSIRLKTTSKFIVDSIRKDGIKYIEIRNIDINPYEKAGISVEDIEFLNLFMMYCFLVDDIDTTKLIENSNDNSTKVANTSNYDETFINCGEGDCNILQSATYIIQDMINLLTELDVNVDILKNKLDDITNRRFINDKVASDVLNNNYNEFFVGLGKKYKEDAYNNRFRLYGYSDLELSTQLLIREAYRNSLEVDIIDRTDNFIEIRQDDKSQIVKQATKTDLDSYVTMLIMENKVVTKKVLEKSGIRVPRGRDFINPTDAFNYAKSLGNNFVIKPKLTNFGIGVNIYTENPSDDRIREGVDIAFSFDKTILVEEYIKGNEYRFLVVDDETVGVLNRVPANVVGDGKNNIEQLVAIKNQNPLRGHGYVTPLEIIKIDDNVKIFLEEKGIDETYIPKLDEVVHLRVNSNVSTGGDSIDITDEVHDFFKQIAVEASKSANAKFNGVDIIIDDYTDETSDYSIIEMNFNPAIHIHSFPFKGKERKIANKILKALGFNIK